MPVDGWLLGDLVLRPGIAVAGAGVYPSCSLVGDAGCYLGGG